jgi:aminocarboxymuconate-semialdehyde decarboxylase
MMAEGKQGPGDLPKTLKRARPLGGDGKPIRTIDAHAHQVFPDVEKLTAGRPERAGEGAFRLKTLGQATIDYNTKVTQPAAKPSLESLEQRLADMDAMGVDMQVLSPAPSHYHYWAPDDLAAEIVTKLNTQMAELCARAPDRLTPLGSIALQHPTLAAEQLRHAVKTLGFKGVEISTNIGGRDLSDRAFDPVWAMAEELDALIFIHPMGCSLNERLAPHFLSGTVGQLVEHAVALGHLIFGGVLDRHETLKVLAGHGGGYFPTHLGRCDHAWEQRGDAHTCQHRPSSYLNRLYYDSLVFDPKELATLIDRVGVSQIVLGTDYPFDMGQYDLYGLLEQTPNLSPADRAAILSGNIARLIGL